MKKFNNISKNTDTDGIMLTIVDNKPIPRMPAGTNGILSRSRNNVRIVKTVCLPKLKALVVYDEPIDF